MFGLLKELYTLAKYQFRKIDSKTLETIESSNKSVLIVTGYKANVNFFLKLKSKLEEKDYSVYFSQIDSNYKKFEIIVENVIKYIKEHEKKEFTAICHSMGTFILLSAMENDAEVKKKIKKIISLSTPYKGSFWGNLLFWDNKRFILKTKSSIRDKILENAELSKITAFRGKWDELVLPSKNLNYNKITTNYFKYGGHVLNLEKEDSLDIIVKEV
jgi:hypothetical protein